MRNSLHPFSIYTELLCCITGKNAAKTHEQTCYAASSASVTGSKMIETLLEEDATERHVVLPPMPIAGMAPIAVVWNAVLGYGVIVSKRSYIRQYYVVVHCSSSF